MKKPFISLKKRSDVIKLLVGLLLCALSLSLFYMRDDSVAVFADGAESGSAKGLYGFLSEML